MTSIRRASIILIGCGVTVGATAASAQEAGVQVFRALRAEPSVRVVVALREPEGGHQLSARSRQIRETRERVFFDIARSEFDMKYQWNHVSAVAGDVSAAGLAKLLADPNVLRVDVDVPGRIATSESATLIRATELHSSGITGAGILVAVLDTGIDSDHPDLADDLVAEQCFCENAGGSGCCPGGGISESGAGSARDEHGHGTHVSGIITGSGGVAPRGIAPDAKIVAIRVLDRDGIASGTAQVVSGLDYLLSSQPDVKVANFSLGFAVLFAGQCDSGASFTIAFAQVINALKARGTMVLASSLNEGSATEIGLPACVGSAVAVGAVYDGNVGSVTFGACTDPTTREDQVTCFSNSNAIVDLLAPGGATTSTGIGGGLATWFGTSQACPHAAGAAALLFQAKPSLSVDQVLGALKSTGFLVTDAKNGMSFPRIDVAAALQATP